MSAILSEYDERPAYCRDEIACIHAPVDDERRLKAFHVTANARELRIDIKRNRDALN